MTNIRNTKSTNLYFSLLATGLLEWSEMGGGHSACNLISEKKNGVMETNGKPCDSLAVLRVCGQLTVQIVDA